MKTLLQNICELEMHLYCRSQAVLKYTMSYSAVVHARFFRSATHGGECGVLAVPLCYVVSPSEPHYYNQLDLSFLYD